MHAVHGTTAVLGVHSSDECHMQQACSASAVGHRSIAGDIAYIRVIEHACNQSGAVRCGRIHSQRAVLFDDEILYDSSFAQAAEKTPVTACDSLVTDDVQVLDVMGVSVEFTGKSVTFLHHGIIAAPGSGGESYRCPG